MPRSKIPNQPVANTNARQIVTVFRACSLIVEPRARAIGRTNQGQSIRVRLDSATPMSDIAATQRRKYARRRRAVEQAQKTTQMMDTAMATATGTPNHQNQGA